MKNLGKFYEAWGANEDESGNPHWFKIASFTDWGNANKACKKKYSGWGGEKDGEVRENTIEIYETYQEFQKATKQKMKEAILSTLSKEEREALDL